MTLVALAAPATWQIAVITVLVLLLLWIISARSHGMTLGQELLHRINRQVAYWRWGVQVHGEWPELFPATGCLVVANHRSSIDPMLVQSTIHRPIRWMIAGEYTKPAALGWILNVIGVLPVARDGNDRAAVREAINALRAGQWIGVFPEGKINTTDDPLLEFHAGVILIAQRVGAPIIPVWIEGAGFAGSIFGAIFQRTRATVTIGTPWHCSERSRGDGLAGQAAELRQAMLDLRTI